MAPIKDPAQALAEHVCGRELADLRATVRNVVRLLPDDTVHASCHMIRHLEEVPNVDALLRHFV